MKNTPKLSTKENKEYERVIRDILYNFRSYARVASKYQELTGDYINGQTIKNWFDNKKISFENAIIFHEMMNGSFNLFAFHPHLKKIIDKQYVKQEKILSYTSKIGKKEYSVGELLFEMVGLLWSEYPLKEQRFESLKDKIYKVLIDNLVLEGAINEDIVNTDKKKAKIIVHELVSQLLNNIPA